MTLEDPAEVPALDPESGCRLDRASGRRARELVEERHLAEDVAGAERGSFCSLPSRSWTMSTLPERMMNAPTPVSPWRTISWPVSYRCSTAALAIASSDRWSRSSNIETRFRKSMLVGTGAMLADTP